MPDLGSAPYVIRGHPGTLENTGFRLEFTPYLIRGRNDRMQYFRTSYETIKSEDIMNYSYVLKELRHHHNRTLVNILGIGIGIALFVSINAVSTAYQKAVSLPFKNLGADVVVQRPEKRAVDSGQPPASMRGIRLPFSNQLLPSGDLEKLKTIEGVDSMASSLLLWEFDKSGFRTIMGVDLAQPSPGPGQGEGLAQRGAFSPKGRGSRP